MPYKTSKQTGFTLMEMAIVIMVIGLLLTSALRPFSTAVEQRRFKKTDQTLEEIKEALLGYAIIHRRLPCPARYFEFSADDQIDQINVLVGVEDRDLCGREGYLPWVDLGVGRYDGWGYPFHYRVDSTYTNFDGIFGSLRTTDNLLVKDSSKNLVTQEEMKVSGVIIRSSRAIAIIFSCGKNNYGEAENDDRSESEKEKCDDSVNFGNNRTYTQEDYTKAFDDRMTWLSKYILAKRLVEVKQWQISPPTASP